LSSAGHSWLDDFLSDGLKVTRFPGMQNHHTPITIRDDGLPCRRPTPYLVFAARSHGCALHGAADPERDDARYRSTPTNMTTLSNME